MKKSIRARLVAASALIAFGVAMCLAAPADAQSPTIAPKTLPRIGTIDERFQSYNIEMVEVMGGRFLKPYASAAAAAPKSANQPTGMDPSLYEYRKPIDLYNARLRKLASALGPAYVRVSGTWANSTFFQPAGSPVQAEAPTGFKGVLTRDQWKGVVEFSKATDTKQGQSLTVPTTSERYTLTAHELTDKQVQLNGVDLKLGDGDSLPQLKGSAERSGEVQFAPASITFLAIPKANNANCRQ